jgi:hypothetical protein
MQITLVFLGTGTLVVCLKHVGITVRQGEVENVSETLASWSAHAQSTRPGNPSGPAALRMFTCVKVLLTWAEESVITQSSDQLILFMHVSLLLASK